MRNAKRRVLVALTLFLPAYGFDWTAPALSAEAEPMLFDMGSTESPLKPGFTRVTAQSIHNAQSSFGWRSGEGIRENVESYDRQWRFDESRGSEQPPPIYTNELTCDTISGMSENAFLVNVAPGRYSVWILAGLSAGSPRDYHAFSVSVSGGDTAEIKIPGPYRFERRSLSANVQDGPLTITLAPKTDWLLSAIAVIPEAELASARRDLLGPLETELDFLPPDVAKNWTEVRFTEPRPLPSLDENDQKRGFALFARHYSEPVFPVMVPRTFELNPELRVFASLGEYEPAAFTILPLRDLPRPSAHLDALRAGDQSIPAENCSVRWVRTMRVRPNYSLYNSYHEAPDVLEDHPPDSLESGRNQTVWITVKVPANAAPGDYHGSILLDLDGETVSQIPLSLRVLPIKLRKNPDHVYGIYYRDPLTQIDPRNSQLANEYFQRKAQLERRDLVEHGLNTHTAGEIEGLSRDDNGNWSINVAATDRRIALDREFGLADKPLVMGIPVGAWYARLVDRRGLGSHLRLLRDDVPPSFYNEITRMVQVVEQERKNRGWPEFLYYPIDEPATDETSVRFMVNVLRAIKQVPGARTYVTADPSKDAFERLWPFVDVWCCQPFVFGHDRIRELSRQRGIEFWCYPNHISGENDHTPVRGARMTFGFGFWKSGFKALIPWIYQSSSGDPWNYLDGSSMDFFNRSSPDGQPIPVMLWEAMREGIDDGRYLYTLQSLIDARKKEKSDQDPLVAQAQLALQSVWDAISVQEKYKYDLRDPALKLGALPPASNLWAGQDMDAYRWLLASWILKLQDRP